ncbi:hypothetical protein [Agrobacterium tumefaciens]|uniref:hypothetical protein n=1 Tax=Agrobacterium tumefaciens TaxID=358 RepID=UPI0015721ED2|nr:hypothetical protein [Agrobacterium tumefaciens]NSZ68688.1 hypothetical protein [Agrobacterium tumefaciens]
MDQNVILWAAGIVISIALAFLGGRFILKKNSQNARSAGQSTIIQSGRDTKIK